MEDMVNELPESLARHIDDPIYPHANILDGGANRSRRRINGTTIFFAVTIALYLLCMCF